MVEGEWKNKMALFEYSSELFPFKSWLTGNDAY